MPTPSVPKVRITIFITPGDEPRPRASGHSFASTTDLDDDSPDHVVRMVNQCALSISNNYAEKGPSAMKDGG